jgi:hypothetical protein
LSKYKDLISEARKPESQKTREPEIIRLSDPEVNLCIKVPASRRRHWAAEAKRHGITMTEVIIEALSEKFGEPKKK